MSINQVMLTQISLVISPLITNKYVHRELSLRVSIRKGDYCPWPKGLIKLDILDKMVEGVSDKQEVMLGKCCKIYLKPSEITATTVYTVPNQVECRCLL